MHNAPGGSDCHINIWDGANKKRIYQSEKYPTSIAALSFSCDGRHLAIASSYAWENGEIDHPNDEIFIRAIEDEQVKPKVRGKKRKKTDK